MDPARALPERPEPGACAQARKGVMPIPPASQICRLTRLRKTKRPYGPSMLTRCPMLSRPGSLRVHPPSDLMSRHRRPSALGALAIVKGCGSFRPASGADTKANWPGFHRIGRPPGRSHSSVTEPCRDRLSRKKARGRTAGAMNWVNSQAATPVRHSAFMYRSSVSARPAGLSTANCQSVFSNGSRRSSRCRLSAR
jgi:hypothetical protein